MFAMSTATLALSRRVSKARVAPDERARYLLRINALGWSQNEAARRCRRDPGHFSRWLCSEGFDPNDPATPQFVPGIKAALRDQL